MHSVDSTLFGDFTKQMIGMRLSHFWFGYGSAIFLEFGNLTKSKRKRRDGSPGNASGEYGVMIEGGWRLEGRKFILCGAWTEEEHWQPAFERLTGATLDRAEVFGHLPELALVFSNGMRCSSFTLFKGDPCWTIFDRRSDKSRTLISRKGHVQHEMPSRPFKSN